MDEPQEPSCGVSEGDVALPGKVDDRDERREEQAELQSRAWANRREPVEGDHTAHTLAHEQRAVVGEVVRRRDVDLAGALAKPRGEKPGELVALGVTLRNDERRVEKVAGPTASRATRGSSSRMSTPQASVGERRRWA